MSKNGASHRKSLRDGRNLFLEGKRVEDVTTHPAFRNSVDTACGLYDFQSAPENLAKMTFRSPETGGQVSRIWQLPTDYEELVQRREAITAWAELHNGYFGRSPDHVASCIAGMFMGLEVFEAYDPRRAGALRDYYAYARDNDLYLSYVIISPQADRSKGMHEQEDKYINAAYVDEDSEGITVRGGKMLGTSCTISNEVFVTNIVPLGPDEKDYALSFVIPLNDKNLKILSRKSYEAAAVSVFDNPLSSRFDENDAVLYFDDVKVPWERVFVCRDPVMNSKQFHETPAHVFQNYQAQIRLTVKLRFLLGIAHKIAETNGTVEMPNVKQTLGELAANVAMVEAMVKTMELKGSQAGKYFVPDRHTLYAAAVLTQKLHPRFTTMIRDLAGGGLIMLPSSVKDFANPELAGYIRKTQRSPATDSEGRVKLFKLAWDAIGSEFGSRHLQYEMFYAGATFVTKSHSYRTYNWAEALDLVDRTLDGYSLGDEPDGPGHRED